MEEVDVAIVGGGPAGLRAAEVAAGEGRKVVIFEGKPSVGRKFLVAGKGGLNLTHGEEMGRFVKRYAGGDVWGCLLEGFAPDDLREWCEGLGYKTFQASSGRVYPKVLKGAPVLRAWLARLREMGVEIRVRHLWRELLPGNVLRFENGEEVKAKAVVFALGGGSWPKTGSDGGWVEEFVRMGISVEPLRSSNCGWVCEWGGVDVGMVEGMPIKNVVVRARGEEVTGELMVTRYGFEGGAIYALGRALRSMERPRIEIDFKPTFTVEELVAKCEGRVGEVMDVAKRAWKLSLPALEILSAKNHATVRELAVRAKNCEMELKEPRPIAEAISSSGGVRWEELDENLMLRKFEGVFVCGEMIDWDAPTGGYLLQGAFAMGTMVGKAASIFALSYKNKTPSRL